MSMCGVIMVLSPAKTLDLTPIVDRDFIDEVDAAAILDLASLAASGEASGQCDPLCDRDKTEMICQVMKSKSEGELKKMLNLSPALAKIAHQVSTAHIFYHEVVNYFIES